MTNSGHHLIYLVFRKNFPELSQYVQGYTPCGPRKIKMIGRDRIPITFEYHGKKRWVLETGGKET